MLFGINYFIINYFIIIYIIKYSILNDIRIIIFRQNYSVNDIINNEI